MPPQAVLPPRFRNLAPRHAFAALNPGELVPGTVVSYTKTEGGSGPQRRQGGPRPRDATNSGGVGSSMPTNVRRLFLRLLFFLSPPSSLISPRLTSFLT